MNRGRVLPTLAAVLLALSGGTAWADSGPAGTPGSVVPQRDAFYTPPATVPDPPGTLIRSRPFTRYHKLGAPVEWQTTAPCPTAPPPRGRRSPSHGSPHTSPNDDQGAHHDEA
ncbi:hypothetical protein F8568_021425 [Actinomadura sp. LD22]|uniref:Uncharacterized protein n=1 Tax=Actinomadura physcomitrii TaxID=2650748 RepID=A0A6I4MJR2_9ACTN|nr:hypothetical protein [Actinomadura physcomitrii]MWA02889.1 hypothetical protein [Actinomadura physcomitrii]